MPTIIQDYRAAGDLIFFLDTRGGNIKDQSGNDHTITVPSDAVLNDTGLHCKTTAATVSLDLSGTQNICVFALVDGQQPDSVNEQMICLHTTSTSTVGSFTIYQDKVDFYVCLFKGSTGICQVLVTEDTTISSSSFISVQFDRRLSYETVKPYSRGVYKPDSDYRVDNNINDGSGFADSTFHLMAYSSSVLTHHGRLLAFGIIDMSTTQLSATDQALLYSQIRNLETI